MRITLFMNEAQTENRVLGGDRWWADGKISGTKFSVKWSEKVMDENETKNGLMNASTMLAHYAGTSVSVISRLRYCDILTTRLHTVVLLQEWYA